MLAEPGEVLVVPAGTAHGFRNDESERLQLVGIHLTARMETDWLEAE